MFDIGASELLVIAIVAILVVGPKDLPVLLRTIGRYLGKMRAMAREFQSQFEEAAREAGLDEMKKSFEEVKNYSAEDEFNRAIAPLEQEGDNLKRALDAPTSGTAAVYAPAKDPALPAPAASNGAAAASAPDDDAPAGAAPDSAAAVPRAEAR
jgi:sec-independent protein translocase protein TatB